MRNDVIGEAEKNDDGGRLDLHDFLFNKTFYGYVPHQRHQQ